MGRMKHRITLTEKDLSGTEWRKMEIKIRLDDECRNGHDDFAITGSAWSKEHNRKYEEPDIGGCIHEEILKVRPGLKPFVDLHLCDSKGAPMYAVENGIYHFLNSSKEVAMRYLRLSESEYEKLQFAVDDKNYFKFLLETMNIVNRWYQEAQLATAVLEQMCGESYVDKSVKRQYEPLTRGEILDVEDKLKNGFYTKESVQERKDKAVAEKKQKQIDKIVEDADKAILKITQERDLKLHILSLGYPISNMIYYDHINELVFNWMDWQGWISKEDFDRLLTLIDYSKLPGGIKIKFGK
jgi:hypothetical protein